MRNRLALNAFVYVPIINQFNINQVRMLNGGQPDFIRFFRLKNEKQKKLFSMNCFHCVIRSASDLKRRSFANLVSRDVGYA